jgi:hypothetical protein
MLALKNTNTANYGRTATKGIMNNPRTSYIIFVRPPGSQMWTQHMKRTDTGPIPYTSYSADKANDEAIKICDQGKYCARVVAIDHPRETDEDRYAMLADADSIYFSAK